MAISYTPLFVAQRILAGEFPETTQTFVFEGGNIGNTHYMAIPFNAPNSEAALLLIVTAVISLWLIERIVRRHYNFGNVFYA